MFAFLQRLALSFIALAVLCSAQETAAQAPDEPAKDEQETPAADKPVAPEAPESPEGDKPAPPEQPPAPEAPAEEVEQPAESAENELSPEELAALDELPDAPPGIILGEVLASKTGAPVNAARVTIVETKQKTLTNNQGRFRFEQVPLGNYTLEIYATGYQTTEETAVVDEGDARPLIATLLAVGEEADDVYALDTVDFLEEYEEPEDTAGISLDLDRTNTLSATVSNEDFAAQAVSNAGDAVARTSGANIVGGKYAVIRGLGDRYSNTLVNGAQIASADPSKKAVQLDLFPSDLLQSVSVLKNFKPNLPAEFAGGTIAIETLKFPEKSFVSLSLGSGWIENLQTNNFLVSQGGRLDFLGDGATDFRKQISPVRPPSSSGLVDPNVDYFPTGGARAGDAETLRARDEWRAIVQDGIRPVSGSHQDIIDHSVAMGTTFDLTEDIKVGAVLSWTHDQSAGANENILTGVARLDADGQDVYDRSQIENEYTNTVQWGALGSLAFQFGEDHNIGFSYLNSRSANTTVVNADLIVRSELQPNFHTEIGSAGFNNTYQGEDGKGYYGQDTIEYLNRDLQLFQTNGSHQFYRQGDREGIKLNWQFSKTKAEEDRPATRRATYYQFVADSDPSTIIDTANKVNTIGGSQPRDSRVDTLKTSDDGINYSADLTIPIYFGDSDDRKFSLGMGINSNERNRSTSGRAFILQRALPLESTRSLAGDETQAAIDAVDNYNNPDVITGLTNRARDPLIFDTYFALQEITTAGSITYNSLSGSVIDAGYLMGTLDWDGWSITTGVRYEDEVRSYELVRGLVAEGNYQTISPNGPESINNTDLLPAFVANYNWGWEKEYSFTFGFSKTIARPTFLEFVPVRTLDQATDVFTIGNQNLENSSISNFDLRFDYRITDDSNFGVGLFHKDIEKPIISTLVPGSSDDFRAQKVNVPDGFIQGIELEYAKTFAENWTFITNYTFLNAKITPGTTQGITVGTDTYEGQPEHIFNLNFGYNNIDLGFRSNLIFNYTSSYLTAVGAGGAPDVSRQPFSSLDLVVAKDLQLFGSDGIVKLTVRNLLDSREEQLYDGSGLIFESFSPGRTIGISYSTEF